jgi:hypothetical protein
MRYPRLINSSLSQDHRRAAKQGGPALFLAIFLKFQYSHCMARARARNARGSDFTAIVEGQKKRKRLIT